jgi:hypothetical protein
VKTSKNRSLINRRSFIFKAGLTAGVAAFVDAPRGQAAGPTEDLAYQLRAQHRAYWNGYRSLLEAAAYRERLALNLEQMAIGSKFNYLFVGAPAAGVELIDPIELKNGITQGMVYLDSPTSSSPRGFYVVRAVALQEVRLGHIAVRVQMLQGGAVVGEEGGMAEVWSLKVPSQSIGLHAQVGVGFDILANHQVVRANCWTCPNGVTICNEKPLCGVDGLLPSGSTSGSCK